MFEHSSRSWKGSPTTWSTAGLLQGILAQPLCFCRRFQKILLSCWCGIEQIGGEMECCLGAPELTSRSAWDTSLCCSCPWKSWNAAEYWFVTLWWCKRNATFAEIQHVKQHFPPLRTCIFTELCFILMSDSGFILDTRMCFLVCAELCYLSGVSPGKKQTTPGISYNFYSGSQEAHMLREDKGSTTEQG